MSRSSRSKARVALWGLALLQAAGIAWRGMLVASRPMQDLASPREPESLASPNAEHAPVQSLVVEAGRAATADPHAASAPPKESGARSEQAVALVNLAEIERAAGRVQAAIGLDREALALMAAPADRARALLSLARDYLASGEPARARRHLEELLRLGLPRSSRYMAYASSELAGLEYAQGALTRTRMMDRADALANTLGVIAGLAVQLTPWRDALLRFDGRE